MFVGDIARAFTNLGPGLAHGIGGFGRKIKKYGEADDSRVAPPIAPRFDRKPDAFDQAMNGLRVQEDAVAEAENNAREDFSSKPMPLLDDSLPDLPIAPGSISMPPSLTWPPSLAELRSSLPILPPARRVTPVAGPAPAPVAAGMEALRPEVDLDRRNLPIPALPGHPGGPTPYDPVAAAKYDYTMAGAKRDAEGNLLGKEEGGGFNRDWKQSALSALAGAARGYAATGDVGGAIGGAAIGGAGSLISPQSGREFVFDNMYRPEIEAREARERVNQERANMEIFNQAKLDDLRATTEERRAQAEKLRLAEVPKPPARQVNLRVGINRETGQREFFDASNPEQLRLFDPEPPRATAPGQPTVAELSVNPESGLSVEEEADASYQARGGDAHVLSKLPARTRQILQAGTVTVSGEERRAVQAEIDAATREWERAITRQRKADTDYTKGATRRKRLGARPQSQPQASGSQPTANLKDLEKLWR